ncbi:MAG: hypothetical protein ACK55Z_25110, partial [bacterium]
MACTENHALRSGWHHKPSAGLHGSMVLSKLAPGCYACKYVFDAQTNQSLAKHFGMNWAVHRMYYLVDML